MSQSLIKQTHYPHTGFTEKEAYREQITYFSHFGQSATATADKQQRYS